MPRKGTATNDRQGKTYTQRSEAPSDFPSDLSGEFEELPAITVQNIGTIASLAVRGGGYFGLSITDDGGSARIAIRNGPFVLDKRFYQMSKFEGALAYCLRKLGELDGADASTK